MDFRLTEKQAALKKEFEDFFKEEMKNAPPGFNKGGGDRIVLSEANWKFHRSVGKKLGARGWLSRAWPKKYGGQDASLIEQLIFNEVRGYYNAPGLDFWGLGMFAPTLLIGGSEEQKQRLLPPIATAEVHYCQGWSEPNAGSDLANVQTTAIRKGDHYIINGQKIWITGAHYADHIFLLARTDPSKTKNEGLSVFSLRMDLPGIEVRPIRFMNREHNYNEVFFTDVKVPEEDRIGKEHDGWRLTRETMNFERTGIETFCETKRYFEDLIACVKTTKRDGKYLAEDPLVRQKMAELYIDIELGINLAYKIAWLQEKGGLILAASAASESKLFSSELEERLAHAGTEILGMCGQLVSGKWAPMGGSMADLYQVCKGFTIAAGSSEIQRNLIAWVGLGLPRFK